MSTYINVFSKEIFHYRPGIHRLSFLGVTAKSNFPEPINHTVGTSIGFKENGVYKITISLNLQLQNVHIFSVFALDKDDNILDSSTMDFFEPIDQTTTSNIEKAMIPTKTFVYQFNSGDSIHFKINLVNTSSVPSLSPLIVVGGQSNVTINKL